MNNKYSSKRVQVYTTYIENNQNENVFTSLDEIKKPKLNPQSKKPPKESQKLENNQNQSPVTSNDSNDLTMSTTNADEDEQQQELTLFMNSFIGVDSFDCANVFVGLLDQDLVLICLNKQSGKNNFCFKGKCSICLIHGQVDVNGFDMNSAKMQNKFWHDLYSPETNSFISVLNKLNDEQSIQDQQNNFSIENLINLVRHATNINFNNDAEENIKHFLLVSNQFSHTNSSIIAIRPLKSHFSNYLNYFENFQHVYQSTNDVAINSSDKRSLESIGLFPVPYFQTVRVNSNEEIGFIHALNIKERALNMNESLVIMAAGGKDVGKSTFLRYLINCLLNSFSKVAYIDLDPGQCEFTLSSCVTLSLIVEPLFGPPHTHISHSDYLKSSYMLGHLSPNDAPGHYIQCFRQCFLDFQAYKAALKEYNIPLVINTMGWNQGLGLCLLKESILLFKPNILIQINHPTEANKNMPTLNKDWLNNVDGWPPKIRANKQFSNEAISKEPSSIEMETNIDEYSDINYELIQMRSQVTSKSNKFPVKIQQKKFSPRDHRNIATIAYFSNLFHPESFFTPLNQVKPYKIKWSMLALHVCHSRVDFDQLFRVFNASLVGLCQIDPKYIKRKEENSELPGYLQNMHDKDTRLPIVYRCVGFGIIRAINIETKEFYILSPEPLDVLSKVNLLVKGMLNLPLEFFYEQDMDTPCPYTTLSDNLQQQKTVLNEPMQRKYLIHQNIPQNRQHQQKKKQPNH